MWWSIPRSFPRSTDEVPQWSKFGGLKERERAAERVANGEMVLSSMHLTLWVLFSGLADVDTTHLRHPLYMQTETVAINSLVEHAEYEYGAWYGVTWLHRS